MNDIAEELDFSNGYGRSLFVLSPQQSSSKLGIPGMQEIFSKVPLHSHTSPILTGTLNRCGDGIEATCSHSAYSTDTTPSSHYSDSFHHGSGHVNLDNSFETSSSSAMDLADFPSTLISGPFSDFNSFSCDPTNSCESSPSDIQLHDENRVVRTGDGTNPDTSLPLQEDEETDIVPNELVQFVSESTLRIAGEMADAVSVTDSDMDDLDHEARLTSLCLPILQPPSLVSSHMSDNMRPPSLSPEPTVNSTDDFVDSDFAKSYFSPPSKVVDGMYSSPTKPHDSTPLYSGVQSPPPLSSAPHVDCSTTLLLPDSTPVNNLSASPSSFEKQTRRLSDSLHSTTTALHHESDLLLMKNALISTGSISPHLQTPVVSRKIDVLTPTNKILRFSDGTAQATDGFSSCSENPASVGQFDSMIEQYRLPTMPQSQQSLPVPRNQSESSILSVRSLTVPFENLAQIPLADHDSKLARQVCLLNNTQRPDTKAVHSLHNNRAAHTSTEPVNGTQREVSPIPTGPAVSGNALPPLQSVIVCTKDTFSLSDPSLVQLNTPASTHKQCLVPGDVCSVSGVTKAAAPSNVLGTYLENIKPLSNGGGQIFSLTHSAVMPSDLSNSSMSSSGTRPISVIIPLPNRTINQGLPQQSSAPTANCTAGHLTLQLLNSLPALRPGMSILLNLKNQTASALFGNASGIANVSSHTNITSSTGSPNSLVVLPELGSSDAPKSTVANSLNPPPPFQHRLGIASSTAPTSLVVVPSIPSYLAPSTVNNGVYPVSTNTGLSASPQPFALPMSTHFFLLRSPKVNVKPESPTIGIGSTPQSGMTLVLSPNAVQKPLSDPTNLFFIPSMIPSSVGMPETPLWFPPSNSVNIQSSPCNASSVAANPSLLTAFGRPGIEPLISSNSLTSMAYVQQEVGHSCTQQVTHSLPPLLTHPISLNQNNPPLSALPEVTLPSITMQLPWSPVANTASTHLQANTQTFLTQLTTLASSLSSSSCLSFYSNIPPRPTKTNFMAPEVTQSVSAFSPCNSALVSLLSPSVSSSSDVTTEVTLPVVANTDTENVKVGDTETSKQPIVLPSADNLLSSRPCAMPLTSLTNPVATSVLPVSSQDSRLTQLVTSATSSSSSMLVSQAAASNLADATVTTKSTSSSNSNSSRRRHQCPYCPKSCERKDNLQAHIRTHTGERPYPCRYCPKAFPQKDHLRAHIRTHTGEKPYRCPQCMKAFAQLGNLHRHVKTHRR
ncbi:hypothetical protein CRM22_008492 [Opisthorchis felineus]|uniref:C2H2-type domain-containing protein n=1 Tax=Opisthorchis felineus TaxID=147828 RepID=A0A4V3SDG8_OPIFE|nr:hypothetical protein CRM22_008492 [Opisthorchis felineus]